MLEKLDLSSAKQQLRGLSVAEREHRGQEIREAISVLQRDLAAMQPNLHAQQRYEDSMSKLRECQKELDEIRDTARDLAKRSSRYPPLAWLKITCFACLYGDQI